MSICYAADAKLARLLQKQLNEKESSSCSKKTTSFHEKENLVDAELELVDPTPNIQTLFIHFDKKYFWNKLNMVEVKWSNRMTTCAGVCSYQGKNGLCSIRLSAPLLSLRPRKDLVETLLHEMIHAYLFVTDDYRDRDDHGPKFHSHMNRINKIAGTNISVYHTFHDEVNHYQNHWWRCNGVCQKRKPYYGVVKRATNRAPGPNDLWWAEHQRTCGGTFVKIKEPEKQGKKTSTAKKKDVPGGSKDIRTFFPNKSNVMTLKDLQNENNKVSGESVSSRNKRKCEDVVEEEDGEEKVREKVRNVWKSKTFQQTKVPCAKCNVMFTEHELEHHVTKCNVTVSEHKCPVCNVVVSEHELNEHLETCLNCSFVNEFDDVDDEVEQTFPCPCCAQLFTENNINSHIDECLTLIAIKDLV